MIIQLLLQQLYTNLNQERLLIYYQRNLLYYYHMIARVLRSFAQECLSEHLSRSALTYQSRAWNSQSNLAAAKIGVEIIRKISRPEPVEMEKLAIESLASQLIGFVESRNLQPVYKQPYLDLLRDGLIYDKSVFNQKRMSDAEQKKAGRKVEKIIFHPTHLVTGQIFAELMKISNTTYRRQLSYGHYGVAKSFSYFLYKSLSDIAIKQIINEDKQTIEETLYIRNKENKRIGQILKIIYLNMKTDKQITQDDVKGLIKQQCPQVPSQAIPKECSLDKFTKSIVSFYKQKNIKALLLVDQINSVVSAFRKFQFDYDILHQQEIDQKKKPQPNEKRIKELQKEKQKILKQLEISDRINEMRFEAMLNFGLVLYNSPVSNEILFPNLPEIQEIKQQINIVEEGKHSGYDTYHKHRVLYPELMRSESAIWSLVDFFLFQEPSLKVDRKEMFKKMAKITEQSVITPLKIREVFTQIKEQSLSNDIQTICGNLKQKSEIEAKDSHSKMEKKLKKMQLGEDVNEVNYLLLLKAERICKTIKQAQAALSEESEWQKRIISEVRRCFLFLNQAFPVGQNENPLENYDKHLGLKLKNPLDLQLYLARLCSYLKAHVPTFVKSSHGEQQIKFYYDCVEAEKLRHYERLKKMMDYNNQQLFILFLPAVALRKLLLPKLPEIYNAHKNIVKSYQSTVFREENKYLFGHFVQSIFIQLLEGEQKLYIPTSDNQQYLKYIREKLIKDTFISLPKKNTKDSEKHVQRFLYQFVNKYKNEEWVLLTPAKSTKTKKQQEANLSAQVYDPLSKSIDCAMVKQLGMTCFIDFFDITVSSDSALIKQKVRKFLSSYEKMEKMEKSLQVSYYIVVADTNYELVKNLLAKEDEIRAQAQSQPSIKQKISQLFKNYKSIAKQPRINDEQEEKIQKKKQAYIKDQEKLFNKIETHFKGSIHDIKIIAEILSENPEQEKKLQEKLFETLTKRYLKLIRIGAINLSQVQFPYNKDLEKTSRRVNFQVYKEMAKPNIEDNKEEMQLKRE